MLMRKPVFPHQFSQILINHCHNGFWSALLLSVSSPEALLDEQVS
jgi:hypothetical protein